MAEFFPNITPDVTPNSAPDIAVYSAHEQAQAWLHCNRDRSPQFACVLGFTETGLIPGISAAGAQPQDRRYTAIADAEFLVNGVSAQPQFALPPLVVGASPVFITRSVVEKLAMPVTVLNAGLPHPPAIAAVDLGGSVARCVSTGQAMRPDRVEWLFNQGLAWGTRLARQLPGSYLVLGECVVGGTTTALAVLTGLGIAAMGKVNSSHPVCNHSQKAALVEQGLAVWQRTRAELNAPISPLDVVAAVGDPMQIVVAGITIAASRDCGVMLAGGTQMLAVYALAQAIATTKSLAWQPEQVVVGTTRWVAEDPTGDTISLARLIGSVPLLATRLNFATSRYPQLQAYERGYVKEGVGAGGCAIAAHLCQAADRQQLLNEVEQLLDRWLSVSAAASPHA